MNIPLNQVWKINWIKAYDGYQILVYLWITKSLLKNKVGYSGVKLEDTVGMRC